MDLQVAGLLPGTAEQTITLISSDKIMHEAPLSAATQMGRLRGLFENPPAASTLIAVPGVRGLVLARIIAWCAVYESFRNRPRNSPLDDYRDLEILSIADDDTLFEMLAAARYLEIEPLLETGRKALEGRVHDKTVEKVGGIYGATQA